MSSSLLSSSTVFALMAGLLLLTAGGASVVTADRIPASKPVDVPMVTNWTDCGLPNATMHFMSVDSEPCPVHTNQTQNVSCTNGRYQYICVHLPLSKFSKEIFD